MESVKPKVQKRRQSMFRELQMQCMTDTCQMRQPMVKESQPTEADSQPTSKENHSMVKKSKPMVKESQPKETKSQAKQVQRVYAMKLKRSMDNLPLVIRVNGQKYVKLVKQRKQSMNNIREYITNRIGKLYPTKKGILLKTDPYLFQHLE